MSVKYQQNYTQGVFVGMVCNAKCGFCNAQIGTTSIKNYFEFYSFDNIKKDILKKVSKGASCIIYEGGDFTIHPEIFNVLEFGNSLGITQTMQTNGIKLANLSFVEKLKLFGIRDINFSLHAYKESVSDKIMGVNGGFKKTIKGLINCNKVGMNISNNLVLTKNNSDQLEGLLLLLLKLNVKLFNISMYIPINNFTDEFHNKFLLNPLEAGKRISGMLSLYTKIKDLSNGRLSLHLKFHNIGRCILDEKFHNIVFELDLDRRHKENEYKHLDGFYKKEDCKRCIHNNNCTGFTQKYIEVFGDDYIKPIYY